MNKKTILAYVLIGLVIIGYFKLNQKSPEDIQREKARQERIAQKRQQELLAEQERAYRLQQQFESIKNDSTNIFHNIYNGVEMPIVEAVDAIVNQGVAPADAVRMIGKDYLRALHVHDNDGKADRHMLPGEGVIDWEDFARALAEVGCECPVSIETSVSGKIPADQRDAAERELANTALRIAGRL